MPCKVRFNIIYGKITPVKMALWCVFTESFDKRSTRLADIKSVTIVTYKPVSYTHLYIEGCKRVYRIRPAYRFCPHYNQVDGHWNGAGMIGDKPEEMSDLRLIMTMVVVVVVLTTTTTTVIRCN